MRTPVMRLDAIGIIRDQSPADLPPNALSDGKNVAILDGKIIPQPGYHAAFTPQVDVLFLAPGWHDQPNINSAWGYLSDKKAKQINTAGATLDVTHAAGDYVFSSPSYQCKWHGGRYNGLYYVNDGFDVPMYFDVGTQKLVDVPNLPAGFSFRSFRGFKNYLVGLYTNNGNPYGMRVMWSHPADPGTYPSSWDITDPTKDAGDYYLSETPGLLVEQGELRGKNIIYKEDSVFIMSYVGGVFVMGFQQLAKAGGILAVDCVTTFRSTLGDMHFVVGPDDIYIHDGVSVSSPLSQRLRSWFYKNLSPTYWYKTVVRNHTTKKEIWIAFPSTNSSGGLDTAIVWNYERNTAMVVDLPNITALAVGPKPYDTKAASNFFSQQQQKLIMGTSGASRKVFIYDDEDYLYDTSPIAATFERKSLAIMGQDDTGRPIPDLETIKLVTEVWPRVEGILGTVMNVYVGSQMEQSEAVTWSGPFPFRIGIDQKVNTSVSGRLISVRFTCTSVNQWKFNGYDLEILPIGKY